MNQAQFDVIVANFKKAVKKGINLEGEINALRHKMGSVEFGVDVSEAEKAIKAAEEGNG